MQLRCVKTDVRTTILLALAVLAQVVKCSVTVTDQNQETVYKNCGGLLKSPRGVISTPSFPKAYPVPIYCRWIVEAPSDKVVALYFTQYYMREGVTIKEYAFFSDSMQLGKKDYGTISSDREPTYILSNKPVVVIEFNVRESGNMHLRVREHLLDVFGFNMTYEIVSRNESIKKDRCVYSHCSFTGACLAAWNFKEFFCHCFGEFFGSECQYGTDCGPSDNGNFCQNGGTCRYFIGSTVKTCDCASGYEGAHCEKKSNPQLPDSCVSMGCTQTCFLTGKSEYRCSCLNGYHLDRDEKTCVEKGRIRYLVSFKVYDQNVDLAHLDTTRYNALKAGIESTLQQLFQPRLHKAENLRVLSFKPAALVQFHFFGESEDTHRAKALFEENLKRGRIGRYAVDKNYIDFNWEPALSIEAVEASEKMPIIEGNELSLACLVQGSVDMKVQWFKDGYAIDVDTTYRDIWISVTPKNMKDHYTALINFEKTHVMDSGEFTCQVTDWGTIQNKSIQVSVIRVPEPVLIPLTRTVFSGDSVVVTCISEGDRGTFGYNWLKNGRILNPSTEPETVEDLFPGGSRLVLKTAVETVKYTCLTTSKAGTAKKDSVITVLTPKGSTPICSQEEYADLKWGQAAANTEDIQPCPEGLTGLAMRKCVLRKKHSAVWSEPDFSKCFSKELSLVMKKLQSLRLGYLVTDVKSLLQDLLSCLWNMRENFYTSSGEPIVDILESIQEYQRVRPPQNVYELKNVSQVFMDIASLLVESPKLIQKQSPIIKLHQLILGYGLAYGSTLNSDSFHLLQRQSFVLEIGRIPKDTRDVLRFPSWRSTSGDNFQEDIPDWLTDSVELEFDSWFLNKVSGGNDSLSVSVVFYRNLSAFFPERFVAKHPYISYDLLNEPDLEYQLHSRLVAVAMQPTFRKPTGVLAKRSIDSKLKVKARLAHLNNTINRRILWNISCGMADFSEGNVQFSMDGCTPVQTGQFSLCQCDRVGTYVVLLTTYAQTEEFRPYVPFDTNAGIGCAVCAFFACLTFFILVLLWRKIKGAITALKIQFCVAIISAYGSILKSLQDSTNEELYFYSTTSVQFFIIAAYSIQLCIGLSVFFEFVGFRAMRYRKLKFAILAWAVPIIVVGASSVAQVPDEYKHSSWWLKFHTKTFYAFSASSCILVVLQIMLVTAIRSEMNYYDIPDSKSHKRAGYRWSLICRSLIITFFLLMASVSSILYVNYDEVYYKHAFGIASGLLGLVIFLCYTACSENVNSLCSSTKFVEDDEYGIKEELDLQPQKNQFESFLKPEVLSNPYIGSKLREGVEMEESVRQLQKLNKLPQKSDEQDWKNIEQLLLQKEKDPSCIVRDFTVHHQASVGRFPKSSGLQGAPISEVATMPRSAAKRSLARRGSDEKSTFELQQLEGSPKSSHTQLHDEDQNGEEVEENYELNHHGSAPDILETASRHSTLDRGAPDSANPSALATDHQQVICSTFRPVDFQTQPMNVLDVVSGERTGSFQKQESDSDDQKPASHSTPPCPPIQSMIGDDKLVCPAAVLDSSASDSDSNTRKSYGKKSSTMPHVGLNVPIPKVPEITKITTDADNGSQQAKKGWNMTAV